MKRKTSTLVSLATEDELLVADILLDLPNIIKSISPFKSKHKQHSFNFPQQLSWSRKRRRSAVTQYRAPSPLLVDNNLREKDEDEEFEQIKEPDGANTGTPTTPLDFVLSDCTNKKSNNNKRSKKKYIKMIDDLTETNETLKREVEKVRKYRDNLKQMNLKYKEMKEKSQKEEMNLGMQLTEQTREMRTVFYQQPLTEMSQNNPYPINPISAQMYSNGLGRANHVGRFDLNVSFVEDSIVISQSQPLVVERDRRTRCREARRMRRGLMKVRKLRNAYGIKLPQHY